MRLQVLDIDGSVTLQKQLRIGYRSSVIPLREWGPSLRLACGFRRFRRFESALTRSLSSVDHENTVRLLGSGDFHHVTLALLRRLTTPINLLVIDNHPDWMRGVPFLHCGTWLYHAAQLPQVIRVFHVGGDVDFDNYYRFMAPWPLLRSGKLSVKPAVRRFTRGAWAGISNEPIRLEGEESGIDAEEPNLERIAEIVRPFQDELARRPLYISLDKDVMLSKHAHVNWDSGHLTLAEVQATLAAFIEAAAGRLAGMDIVGDWSRVETQGTLRRAMHLTMHPALSVDAAEARVRNEATNLKILAVVERALAQSWKQTA